MRDRFLPQWGWGLLAMAGLVMMLSGCATIAELLKGVQKTEDEAALVTERADTQTQLDNLKDEDAKTRRTAVATLRGRRALVTFAEMGPMIVMVLRRHLTDEDPGVVREVVQTLAVFANVQEQDPEEREIDPEQRERLISIKAAAEETLPQIPPQLQSPDPETRWWAAQAIYNMTVLRPHDLQTEVDPTPAIQPLISVLKDESLSVRILAAQTLLGLQATQAVDAIIEALQQDQAPEVRRIAAWALGDFGDPRAAPALLAALQNQQEDVGVRWRAARALGLLGAQDAVPALLATQEQEDRALSSWSVYALSLIGTPEAQQRLAQLDAEEAQLAQTAIEEKIIEEKRRRAFLRGR